MYPPCKRLHLMADWGTGIYVRNLVNVSFPSACYQSSSPDTAFSAHVHTNATNIKAC